MLAGSHPVLSMPQLVPHGVPGKVLRFGRPRRVLDTAVVTVFYDSTYKNPIYSDILHVSVYNCI